MAEIGTGSGSNYPASLDTDTTQEVNTPNAGRTKARAEVVNDLASAIVAIETELGTDPAGSLTDVKTYLQTEHNADATHKVSLVGMLAGAQTFTGSKTFSATMKLAKGADVVSGTALALGADGNSFDITGTTAITSIQTVAVGTVVVLQFDAALTLTHHATDLILPTAANITTAAGDIGVFYEYATGDWRCISYSRANGEALAITNDAITTAKILNDAVTQDKIGDSAVGQAQLKTTTGEVSTGAASANLTLPGGEYGFYPQVKKTAGATSVSAQIANAVTGTAYATNIYLSNPAADGTIYAQQRYVQASPPYMIGDKVWGHFLFLLRDIATATVKSAYEAEDPPWAYNGATWLAKDHPDRIAEVPHPFVDYWTKDPAVDGLEIVMVDLTMRDVKRAKEDNWKMGKGLLQDIPALISGKGKAKAHTDYLLPNIPRFTDKVKIVTP